MSGLSDAERFALEKWCRVEGHTVWLESETVTATVETILADREAALRERIAAAVAIGLSEAERDELCICPWDVVGPTPDTTHEYRCTRHMEKITAREAVLRERIAAAWDEGYTAGHRNAMRRMSDLPWIAPTSPNPYRIARETP